MYPESAEPGVDFVDDYRVYVLFVTHSSSAEMMGEKKRGGQTMRMFTLKIINKPECQRADLSIYGSIVLCTASNSVLMMLVSRFSFGPQLDRGATQVYIETATQVERCGGWRDAGLRGWACKSTAISFTATTHQTCSTLHIL